MAKAHASPDADDTDAYVKAVQDGLRSLDEGQKVPYEKVRDWLMSWGTDRETPPPECP